MTYRLRNIVNITFQTKGRGWLPVLFLVYCLNSSAQESRSLFLLEQSTPATITIQNGEETVQLPEVLPLTESWSWDGVTGILTLKFRNGRQLRAVEGTTLIRLDDTLLGGNGGVQSINGTLWIPTAALQAAGVQILGLDEVPATTTPTAEPSPTLAVENQPTPTPDLYLLNNQLSATSQPVEPIESEGPLLRVLIDPSVPTGIQIKSAEGYDRQIIDTIFEICAQIQEILVNEYGVEAWLSIDESSYLEGQGRPSPQERTALGNRLHADLILSLRGGRSFGNQGSIWTVAYHTPRMGHSYLLNDIQTGPRIGESGLKLYPWNYVNPDIIETGYRVAIQLHRDLLLYCDPGPLNKGEPGPLPGGTKGPRPAPLALAKGSLAPVVVVALGNATDNTTLQQFPRFEWRRNVAEVISLSLYNWARVRRGFGEIPFQKR